MGRYFGKIGYAITVERVTDDNPPKRTGIWEDKIIERDYYGDSYTVSSKWRSSGNLNDNLEITNNISILADAFAYQNFSRIKYVEYMGEKWKVAMASVARPRIILTLGGVYNGEE